MRKAVAVKRVAHLVDHTFRAGDIHTEVFLCGETRRTEVVEGLNDEQRERRAEATDESRLPECKACADKKKYRGSK